MSDVVIGVMGLLFFGGVLCTFLMTDSLFSLHLIQRHQIEQLQKELADVQHRVWTLEDEVDLLLEWDDAVEAGTAEEN